MSERMKTRRELVAEGDSPKPERIKGLEELQRLGVFIPMRDLDLYHGRAGNGSTWRVVDIDNAGNATGNYNINKLSALNTGTQEVASAFAAARALNASDAAQPEIHSIVSNDIDASIVDLRGKRLSSEELRRANEALEKMTLGLFEGAPLRFSERGTDIEEFKRFFGDRKAFVTHEEATEYARKTGIPVSLSWRMCGAANAQKMLRDARLVPYAVDHFMNGTLRGFERVKFDDGTQMTVQSFKDDEGNIQRLPVNHEYIASWLQANHVVGAKMRVRSATLGGAEVDNYLLFDYERVNTREFNEGRRRSVEKKLGAMSLIDGKFEKHNNNGGDVMSVINNLYAKPKEIVESAEKVPGFERVFESGVGVWEGFTLKEHTETVLRNFERNYADRVHAKMIPFVRMALLVHDIGKPKAVLEGRKEHQRIYNAEQSNRFMEQLGLRAEDRWLIIRLIGDGMDAARDYALNRTRESERHFYGFCKDTLKKYGRYEPSAGDITGLRDICLVLQTCDSAAYTDMAITHSGENGLYFRNHPSFNGSFAKDRKGKDGMGARLGRDGGKA